MSPVVGEGKQDGGRDRNEYIALFSLHGSHIHKLLDVTCDVGHSMTLSASHRSGYKHSETVISTQR